MTIDDRHAILNSFSPIIIIINETINNVVSNITFDSRNFGAVGTNYGER